MAAEKFHPFSGLPDDDCLVCLRRKGHAIHSPSATPAPDSVNHPARYTAHPSGVECIQIAEHMGFNLGNALKYIWRADLKGNALEDLRKAAFYVNREIERRTHGATD